VTAVSFMSANLVARETGWAMRDWGHGDAATNEAFRPLESYADRLGEVLELARGLGFDAVDLWTAHLNPAWATDEHLRVAREQLDLAGLQVVSLAGGFGASPGELEQACRVAKAVGAPVLGGAVDMPATAPEVVAVLRRHGVRLALENHPDEATPADVLALVGDGAGGLVGTTVDTGWWGTHGVDAADAIEELAPHVLHVHLKDVRRAGAHDTCAWGEGVVPIEQCVRTLRAHGYEGAISVEHEPPDEDPTAACGTMRVQLEEWLR
jgi:L-ribulose-5-phosphate 3-epimerase